MQRAVDAAEELNGDPSATPSAEVTTIASSRRTRTTAPVPTSPTFTTLSSVRVTSKHNGGDHIGLTGRKLDPGKHGRRTSMPGETDRGPQEGFKQISNAWVFRTFRAEVTANRRPRGRWQRSTWVTTFSATTTVLSSCWWTAEYLSVTSMTAPDFGAGYIRLYTDGSTMRDNHGRESQAERGRCRNIQRLHDRPDGG